MTNWATPAQSTLSQGLAALSDMLGEGWEVTPLTPASGDGGRIPKSMFDGQIQITPPDGSRFVELLVDVREQLTPRHVIDKFVPIVEALRIARAITQVLVISPWLSQRTRDTLREHGIGYLDLTGNAWLAVTYPAIHIYTHGSSQPPKSARTAVRNVTLAGPRAARVVRFLADVTPPYRASQIAEAADVSAPWVSRLLSQLEDQLLIERDGHTIKDVRWPDLLRARAESSQLLRRGSYVPLIALRGIGEVLSDLKAVKLPARGDPNIAVTGSYAARAVAPLAVGGQLMLYVDHKPHAVDEWADQLGLIRVDEGADVLIIRASDKAVFDRCRIVDGIVHVAHSQLVLDCLSGSGRMPAEGEAVLEMMIKDERRWRATSVATADAPVR